MSKIKLILKKLIANAGLNDLNHVQLAKKLGIPNSTLHQLLNFDNISPRVETLKSIAKYFNITIDQLIDGSKINNSKQRIANTTSQELDLKQDMINAPSQEWNSETYLKCVILTCDLIRRHKLLITTELALNIISEAYAYTLDKNKGDIDLKYIELLVEHYLKT